jgi:hypothetical protein
MLLRISWRFLVVTQSLFAGVQSAIFARRFVAFCNELKNAQKYFQQVFLTIPKHSNGNRWHSFLAAFWHIFCAGFR